MYSPETVLSLVQRAQQQQREKENENVANRDVSRQNTHGNTAKSKL